MGRGASCRTSRRKHICGGGVEAVLAHHGDGAGDAGRLELDEVHGAAEGWHVDAPVLLPLARGPVLGGVENEVAHLAGRPFAQVYVVGLEVDHFGQSAADVKSEGGALRPWGLRGAGLRGSPSNILCERYAGHPRAPPVRGRGSIPRPLAHRLPALTLGVCLLAGCLRAAGGSL